MADQHQSQASATGSYNQSATAVLPDGWDEERLFKALDVLKDLHIRLRDLRTTIPGLIAPLATKQPSPEALYNTFSEAAQSANSEVQEFRKAMNDPATLEVLEQAKKSRLEQPKGIKPWKASDHPDWLTRGT